MLKMIFTILLFLIIIPIWCGHKMVIKDNFWYLGISLCSGMFWGYLLFFVWEVL
jgi:hypothetical protein